MTEVFVFALVVGNYGFGLKRDGLPYLSLCGAATAVYWAVRLVGGFTFLAVARHVGRDPLFFGESVMMAAAPVAAVCAYAVVRVLEARALEALVASEARAAEPAPAATAAPPEPAPAPVLPATHDPHPRLSLREERVLAIALVAAGCIVFGHTLATARPFWREDLGADDRTFLRRRADELARLETRLLECGAPAMARDREAHRRALEELSRRGLLRIGGHRAEPAAIQRRLEALRAERCGPRSTP